MEPFSGYVQIQELIKNSYTQKTYKEKKCPLHHLIALKQPIKNIQNYLDKLDKKRIKEIMKGDSGMNGFTPLHISLFAPFEIFILILNKTPKGEIDAKDQYGWTALHHTVLLTEPEKYEKALLENGADPDEKTDADGTLLDLKRLFGKEVYAPSKKTTTIEIDGKDRKLSEVTEEELFSLTGLKKYTDCNFFLEEDFLQVWEQEFKDQSGFEFLKSKIQQREKKPPFLKIKKEKDQYTLRAGEKLLLGTCLGSYTGLYRDVEQLKKEEFKDRSYWFPPYDAKETGNVNRFINNGFPNAVVVNAIFNGVTESFLFAGEKNGIQEGELICYAYGISYPEIFDNFSLLRKKELELFFKPGLSSCIETIDKIPITQTISFKEMELRNKIMFPLEDPKAFFYLHFKKIVFANEWLNVIACMLSEILQKKITSRFMMLCEEWFMKSNFQKIFLSSLMQRVDEWDKKVNDPKVKEITSKWMIEQIDSFSAPTLLQGLSLIQKHAEKNQNLPECEWDTFFLSLPEQLKNYDFFEDEEGGLSPKQIYQDLRQVFSKKDIMNLVKTSEKYPEQDGIIKGYHHLRKIEKYIE